MISDLLILTAPTASGKTELSIELSKRFPIEIISSDSRQVYKLMDIGTAKASQSELNQVKHHLIDIILPDETYSAGKFENDAKFIINQIINDKKIPLIVGGTGFYVKSLIYGLDEDNIEENIKVQTREFLKNILESEGPDKIKELLKEKDIDAYNLYSGQNIRRLTRALEFYLVNGYSITKNNINQKKLYNPKYFIISTEREILYDRINKRTIEMWENGLESEVQNLLNLGYGLHNNSLNSVGYRECIYYVNGNLSKDIAISEIQKNTRRFAKRQITWQNNQMNDSEKFLFNSSKLFDKLCIECENFLKNIS